jgi:hypothetical protein
MEKKSPRPRIAPLRKVQAELVTDPAEQAELDQQRNRQPDVVRTRGSVRLSEPESPSPVVELSRKLPAEERQSLIMRMVAGLSPEMQFHLLEQLAAQLPADVVRQLEEELQARLVKAST